MDEWTDSVRIAIDLIVACVIISALILCMMLGNRIARYMDNSVAAAADVKEYRVANSYQGTIVYPQDVVNVILTNQGAPAIYVKNSNGTERAHYTPESYSTPLTSEDVASVVSPSMNDKFLCTLDFAVDGGIKSYTFRVTP